MLVATNIINRDLNINSLEDLYKLRGYMDVTNEKVNVSAIARKLGKDRRTVNKYIDGYTKPNTRKKKSELDNLLPMIEDLLKPDNTRIFYYKSHLYRFLIENYKLRIKESTFRHWAKNQPVIQEYFESKRYRKTAGGPAIMRYETKAGKQAQIDWKESMKFTLSDGEVIELNIFVYILSYSRFRIYQVSLSKSQSILMHFLDNCFEITGGVPKTIVTDNMKTVMDVARTEYRNGKVNDKFQEFAKDYGFNVHPCIAGRPNTKAKVESPMRILDELYVYNGYLNYDQLVRKVQEINERENQRYHKAYEGIPINDLQKEKGFLTAIPNSKIRSQYTIRTDHVKVNQSSMITYQQNQYSVPPNYIGETVEIQSYDGYLHIYYEKELIAIHQITKQRLNYQQEHYEQIAQLTISKKAKDIEEIAKENLKMIGEKYK